MMTSMLVSCVIMVVGSFGLKRSTADLKRWIETSGGEFTSRISARVTHLVCSKRAWKDQYSIGESMQTLICLKLL